MKLWEQFSESRENYWRLFPFSILSIIIIIFTINLNISVYILNRSLSFALDLDSKCGSKQLSLLLWALQALLTLPIQYHSTINVALSTYQAWKYNYHVEYHHITVVQLSLFRLPPTNHHHHHHYEPPCTHPSSPSNDAWLYKLLKGYCLK